MTITALDQDLTNAYGVVLTLTGAGEDIAVDARIMERPSVRRHASKSMLYTIAIQQLVLNGTLDAIVDSLLADGPINAVDAANTLHRNSETLNDRNA